MGKPKKSKGGITFRVAREDGLFCVYRVEFASERANTIIRTDFFEESFVSEAIAEGYIRSRLLDLKETAKPQHLQFMEAGSDD